MQATRHGRTAEAGTALWKAADSVRYTGYTNAGTGLTKALELLDTVEASEKTVVMLSDGEIVMQDDAATAVSSGQFENAVTEVKELRSCDPCNWPWADMENKANIDFYRVGGRPAAQIPRSQG